MSGGENLESGSDSSSFRSSETSDLNLNSLLAETNAGLPSESVNTGDSQISQFVPAVDNVGNFPKTSMWNSGNDNGARTEARYVGSFNGTSNFLKNYARF